MTTDRIKSIHWLYEHVEITSWDDFESALEQAHAQLLKFISSPRS